MKIIEEKEKKLTIVLDDDEEVNILTLHGSKEKLVVKCFQSSLHVDEFLLSEVKEKSLEKKEIKKMATLLKNKNKD